MENQLLSRGSTEPLLKVRGLKVKYKAFKSELTAINNLSLDVKQSEILAIVGESGCGKSTLGLSIIRLLQSPPAFIESGSILYRDQDILALDESKMEMLRGTSISMIFQEPMSSLDPVYNVGEQITESIEVREGRKRGEEIKQPFRRFDGVDSDRRVSNVAENLAERTFGNLITVNSKKRMAIRREKKDHRREGIEALKSVKIADPERVMKRYPHELSGGMAQRIMIARALIEKPSILIADEPTSALDVTTQAQVLSLVRKLRDDIESSIIFITHDLAVAAQIADRVVVMYAGEIVENAPVREIFTRPVHPYTQALINCFPDKYKFEGKLEVVSGDFPNLRTPPGGCRFHPRCRYAFEKCGSVHPELKPVRNDNHLAACFLAEENRSDWMERSK